MKNIRSSYKQYCKETQEPVDIKDYIEISSLYMKFLIDKVFDNYEVTLPSRMGTLKIVGTKQKVRIGEDGKIIGLSPNWRKTKELWDKCPECKEKKQLIYNTNEHSGGIRYKFLWSKKRVLVTNKTLYSLRMIREHKRGVFKRVTKEGKEYITQ